MSQVPGAGRVGLPPTHRLVVLVAETMAKYQRVRWLRRRRSPMDFVPMAREIVATLFLLPEGQRLVADALASDEPKGA